MIEFRRKPDEFTPRNYLKERIRNEVPPEFDEPLDEIVHPPRATSAKLEPLDEIATLVRALTYGEMMELADGMWKAKPEGMEVTAETLPVIWHKWSQARGAPG